MITIKVSVQGQKEKYRSEIEESLDVVSDHIRNLMKNSDSLLFEGEDEHTIIPIHAINMIEIFE